ncbi:MAG: hypothetical protein IJH34_15470 [Romboutsia sp.]|nr:hypothetical protein [Romboutsia sp.]
MLINIPSGLNKMILRKGQELYSWGYTYKKVCKYLQLEYNLGYAEAHLHATYSRVPNILQIA